MLSQKALLPLILVPLACCLCASAAPATRPTSPKEVFSSSRLHTIELNCSPAGWKLMQPRSGDRYNYRPSTQPVYVEGERLRASPSGMSYAYTRAVVTIDGQVIPDVGLRFKGNVSYGISAHSPRRPFKLDFNRFVEGQHFAKLSSLNLNNSAFDPSELREALSFALFTEMGVPAPRTGFASVYLTVAGQHDRDYLGQYLLIEEVDKHFLKKNFGTAEGLLLKPEGLRGLPYLGEDFARYAPKYSPKTDDPHRLAGKIVELARLVNRADDATFAAQISSCLAVDEFLRYVAVNAAICNTDSFLSTGHNYFMYVNPADGRVYFIPWDMNLAFGGHSWLGTAQQMGNLSISHPWTDHNRLCERLLAIPQYNQAYRNHIRTLAGLFAPEELGRRMSEFEPIFQQSALAAQRAGKTGNPSTRPATGMKLIAPPLLPFAIARGQSMQAQLAGKEVGFIAAYNNAELLPPGMAGAAPFAIPLMNAVDTDHDQRLSESEITAAIQKLWATANLPPEAPLSRAAAMAAIERLLSPELRKLATAERWTAYLFRSTGTPPTGQLTPAMLQATYQRLLRPQDRDSDALLDIRETVETVAHLGAP